MQLYQGDCLEVMKDIPDKSIDMILCDLPFGTTCNAWDKKLDLNKLFQHYERIVKNGGAIALFSQMPFSVDLVNANRKHFRYEWVWQKNLPVGFLNANKMPLRSHENILIFYDKLPTYNPQMEKGKRHNRGGTGRQTTNYGKFDRYDKSITDEYYPRDIINFSTENSFGSMRSKFHPTQKPVPLLEYLIRTYTNDGETVLDNCMGSGSTGVACVNTNRDFIGIELDENYFKIAKERIEKAKVE